MEKQPQLFFSIPGTGGLGGLMFDKKTLEEDPQKVKDWLEMARLKHTNEKTARATCS